MDPKDDADLDDAERPIRYARENFVYGREFLGDTHLDAERERWLAKANARNHATTKERPVERFERDERHVLKPLAAQPYRSLVLVARKERPSVTIVVPVREEVERRPLFPFREFQLSSITMYCRGCKDAG